MNRKPKSKINTEVISCFCCIYGVSIGLILSGIILMPYVLGIGILLVIFGALIAVLFTVMYASSSSSTKNEPDIVIYFEKEFPEVTLTPSTKLELSDNIN
jgi:hypothetical protein